MCKTRNITLGLLLMIISLSGCGISKEQTKEMLEKSAQAIQPVMDDASQAIMDGLDKLKETKAFENNLDGAKAYLLGQLEEKYGMPFMVTGNEKFKDYGVFSGVSYSCEVAPIDHPEQVTKAIVSQTTYQDVHDNYARYYFKEEAEHPAYTLCASKPYVIDQRVSLEAPGTAKTWRAEDGLDTYLSQSGAYVKIVLRLEDGLEVKDYAEQILDFLRSVPELNCRILLQAKANKTYIFHQEIDLQNGFDINTYTLEWLEEEIEEDLQMGSPVFMEKK